MPLEEKLKKYIEKDVFIKQGEERIVPESSKWLMDFRRVCLDPEFLDIYTEIFYERFHKNLPFQVGGMEVAAIPLVSAIVMKMREKGKPINGFFIRKSRKKTGLLRMIEGKLTDEPVILVDDLINKGSTLDRQIKIMKESGKEKFIYFVLLRFRDGGMYEKYESEGARVESLFSLDDFQESLGVRTLEDDKSKLPKESFKVEWKFRSLNPKLEHVIPKSGIVIDDRRIYFGSDQGIFWALNQEDGSIAWQQKISFKPGNTEIFSTPILCGSRLYFGAYDGNIYCLDAETGKKLWVSMEADWVHGSCVISEDKTMLYVPVIFGLKGKEGGIVALNAETGKHVWTSSFTDGIQSSPLLVEEENIILTGSENGTFFCLNAKTGKEIWKFKTEGAIKDAAIYDKKRKQIIFSSFDGHVYTLSCKDGSLVWKHNIGLANFSSPVLWEEKLYVASLDKNIYCFNYTTGKKIWHFETKVRIFSRPYIYNNYLYIGANDGRMYKIDSNTGKQVGFFQTTERITNPVVINPETNKFYLQTYANEVFCLTPHEDKKS